MFLSFLAAEATEDQIDLVKWITIGVLLLLVIVILLLSTIGKKQRLDTKTMVFAAICISTSFALSYLKFSMPYGGSITFASLVPLMIFAYAFGPVRGLLAGLVYGLLQFIQDPWFLTGIQFVLDYLLAFGAIALLPVFKKVVKSQKASVLLGVAAFGIARLAMHICSGIVFVQAGWVTEVEWMANLADIGAFLYSLVYNGLYVLPDTLICAAVFVYLLYSGAFSKLLSRLSVVAKPAPVVGETREETENLPEDQKK